MKAPPLAPTDIELRPERFTNLVVPPSAARAVLARLAGLCGTDAPFLAATREADGLSLVLREEDARELGDLLLGATAEPDAWRVVTFRPTLPWTVVGFLAKVTALLAAQGIPLGAVTAYRRDHLFVTEARAATALEILRAAARDGRLP